MAEYNSVQDERINFTDSIEYVVIWDAPVFGGDAGTEPYSIAITYQESEEAEESASVKADIFIPVADWSAFVAGVNAFDARWKAQHGGGDGSV